jgi:class 3 adenylate cyclase
MLYQFVGDEVIGLFGIPKRSAAFANDALETAHALLDIGNSISQYWQRHIDRLQDASGLHIGLAVGDLLCVPSRPYSRTHMECIGDGINMASRLMRVAGPSEIVASNSFHQLLDGKTQAKFQELEPVDARNVGRIGAWKLPVGISSLPRR